MQSISETSPTGTTITQNYSISQPRRVVQSNFLNCYEHNAVYGGHFPGEPFRPAQYQQNWTGFQRWQSWEEAGGFLSGPGYPTEYRKYLVRGNVEMAASVLIGRNRPQEYSPAPIAIQSYALATQQVYSGSAYTGGYYG